MQFARHEQGVKKESVMLIIQHMQKERKDERGIDKTERERERQASMYMITYFKAVGQATV